MGAFPAGAHVLGWARGTAARPQPGACRGAGSLGAGTGSDRGCSPLPSTQTAEEEVFPAGSPVPLSALRGGSHYSAWVQARNALGTARSAPRHLNLRELGTRGQGRAAPLPPALPSLAGPSGTLCPCHPWGEGCRLGSGLSLPPQWCPLCPWPRARRRRWPRLPSPPSAGGSRRSWRTCTVRSGTRRRTPQCGM